MSVATHAKLAEKVGPDVELVPAGGLVEQLRAVKDADEVAAMRAAAELATAAYESLLERGLAGRTERDVAIQLDALHGGLGRRGPVASRRSWRRRSTARIRTRSRATSRSRGTRSW